jgi:hypothetical protein
VIFTARSGANGRTTTCSRGSFGNCIFRIGRWLAVASFAIDRPSVRDWLAAIGNTDPPIYLKL